MKGPKYIAPSSNCFLVTTTFGYFSFVIFKSVYVFPSINRILYLGLCFLMSLSSRRNASISEVTPIVLIDFICETRFLVFSPKFLSRKYEETLFFKFNAFPT